VDLNNLVIEIRPRQAWEAVDLGLLVGKRWWWPLVKLWLILALPVVVLTCFIPVESLWWQLLILWWLKPIFERPLLIYLSRVVFGENPTVREILRASTEVIFRRIFPILLWVRFSPYRATSAPVILLERLTGSMMRDRLSLINRQGMDPIVWMSILGSIFEVFLTIGIFSLMWALIPRDTSIEFNKIFSGGHFGLFQYVLNGFAFVSMTLVAPFYVALGFSLYLNRRARLEAWDLEIDFRRMVQKREKVARSDSSLSSAAGVKTLASLLMIATLLAYWPSPGNASDAPQAQESKAEQSQVDLHALDRERSQKLISEVMADADFHHIDVSHHLQLKDNGVKKPDKKIDWKWLDGFFEFLKKIAVIFSGLSTIAEWALWLAVLLLIFFVVFRYRHWWRDALMSTRSLETTRRNPVSIMGLDLREETLPEDVGEAAAQLANRGDLRASLSLLYRASLMQLLRCGVELENSFTELECVRAVNGAGSNVAGAMRDYFLELTGLWRELAWGHQMPGTEVVLNKCRNWNDTWLRSWGKVDEQS